MTLTLEILEERVHQLDKRLGVVEARQETQGATIEAIRKDVALILEHQVMLGKRMDIMHARLDDLDARFDQMEARITSIEGRLGRLATGIAALRRDIPGMMMDVLREFQKEQGKS